MIPLAVCGPGLRRGDGIIAQVNRRLVMVPLAEAGERVRVGYPEPCLMRVDALMPEW